MQGVGLLWLFWTWCSAPTELGCKEVITRVCDRHPLLYNRFEVKAWESHIEQNTDASRSVLILLMEYILVGCIGTVTTFLDPYKLN
jgi:hypothetical protein